jgi:hypothetical protein
LSSRRYTFFVPGRILTGLGAGIIALRRAGVPHAVADVATDVGRAHEEIESGSSPGTGPDV